jgi:hypothetical protein
VKVQPEELARRNLVALEPVACHRLVDFLANAVIGEQVSTV